MATCPSCGTRYSDSQRLCPRDGTVLEADQAPELAAVGKVLDGKYRLDAFLSRGGMGAVYQATHVMLNRKVAVKLISPQLVMSADTIRRFQREARAVTHLNHPNIVRVHDLGETADGTLYIAMDLIAGQSLSDVIQSSQPLAAPRIVHIATQIVSALAHAHDNGVIHRDLKPQNIMITRRPDGREVVTLLDFGIAKTFEVDAATRVTSTGFTVGSPRYMSPEQAGAAPVDGRSDIYSAGVILYEMLTGEVPFDDPSTPAILVKHLTETPMRPSLKRPDGRVPPVLERITMRCLEKKPEARFQSAADLQHALAEAIAAPAVAGDTGAATTIASTPRPPTPGGRGADVAPRDGARRLSPAAAAPPATSPWRRYVAAAAVVVLLSAAAIAIITRSTRSRGAPQPNPAPSQPALAVAPPATAVAPPAADIKAAEPAPPQAPPQAPAPAPARPPGRTARGGDPGPAGGVRPQRKAEDPPLREEVPLARTPLSRALTSRVRMLLAERGIGQGRFRAATLAMTMRPSGTGRGVTAEYVVTVYTSGGERTFSGSQQGPAPQLLRNAIIEGLAAEIATRLAAPP